MADAFLPESLCPCHSGGVYTDCCRPYHVRQHHPASPLLLMRSRYAAYALGLIDYVMDTTHRNHPDYNPNRRQWRAQLTRFSQRTRFENLIIVACSSIATDQDIAWVHFQAMLRVGAESTCLEEKSRFVRLGKRWLYESALML